MINYLKSKLQMVLWISSIGTVITIGLYYFPIEYKNIGFWETLYFTLRLFFFEHDLPNFPQLWPLVFIYFFAPVITISAAGTVITYLFRISPVLKTRWMSNHVMICGVGRTGKLFASALKKKGVKVVGIDLEISDDLVEWSGKNKVPMISGDFNLRSVLEKSNANRARSLIFASGDDLENLEGAISAYEWLQTDEGPVRLIWTQITNERLADVARASVRTSGKVGIRFFDTYRIAVVKMISKYFNKEIRKGIKEVNIFGFGKFGYDLLDVLVNDLDKDEKIKIRVIDIKDRAKAVQSLTRRLNIEEMVRFEMAAVQDIQFVDDINNAFFICTDDDMGNLTAAMSLVKNLNIKHIYVRMHHWPISAIAENLGEEQGVFFININDLVVQGITDLPGIFKNANISDLKRIKLGSTRD